MKLLLLLVIGGLMYAARSFAPEPAIANNPAGTSLAFGYLLLSAFIVGGIFHRAGLPRLTGYLVTGLVVGPTVLGLLTEQMVVNLRIFNGVAIALIALTAGTEMEFRSMRPLLRSIGWITLIAIVGTAVLLTAVIFWARPLLPFMAYLGKGQAVAVCAVLAVAMVAQSPAVAVALRNEMQADGPVSRTVLGIVVLADIVVILLFAAVSSVAQNVLGGVVAGSTLLYLAREIIGSAAAGVVIGLLAGLFLRKVTEGGAFFVVAVGFLVAEVGQRIGLDPLLIALAAGLYIRNATGGGERLHRELETASLPVYVAFFAVAGATIHLNVLLIVGIPAGLFVLTRAAGFLTGAAIATRIAGAPDTVRHYVGFGMLPQAGLALALALLFARLFPQLGEYASTLIFAVVAINELLAPVVYRQALVRAGEAGAQQQVGELQPATVAGA